MRAESFDINYANTQTHTQTLCVDWKLTSCHHLSCYSLAQLSDQLMTFFNLPPPPPTVCVLAGYSRAQLRDNNEQLFRTSQHSSAVPNITTLISCLEVNVILLRLKSKKPLEELLEDKISQNRRPN